MHRKTVAAAARRLAKFNRWRRDTGSRPLSQMEPEHIGRDLDTVCGCIEAGCAWHAAMRNPEMVLTVELRVATECLRSISNSPSRSPKHLKAVARACLLFLETQQAEQGRLPGDK